MKHWVRIATFASLVAFSSFGTLAQDKAIVGTWAMVSNTGTDAAGKSTPAYGEKPMGQVIFTADGRYTIVIMRPDIGKFAGNNRLKATDKEKMAVNDGMIAHFGKYKANGKELVVSIEGSSFPNWNGSEQKRVYTIKGKELRWTNANASAGGNSELVWKKL
jgi:hypothetical protein